VRLDRIYRIGNSAQGIVRAGVLKMVGRRYGYARTVQVKVSSQIIRDCRGGCGGDHEHKSCCARVCNVLRSMVDLAGEVITVAGVEVVDEIKVLALELLYLVRPKGLLLRLGEKSGQELLPAVHFIGE
jgi:hypothetical protein